MEVLVRKEVVIYRVCDMPHRGEVRAEATEKVSLNGYRYEIDLCPTHSAALATALGKFTDFATKTGEPTVFDKPRVTKEVTVAPRKTAPEPKPIQLPFKEPLPLTAERWQLSQHAVDRQIERGLNLYDVLLTAERPQQTHASPKDPALEERFRDDVYIVVNPETHTIVTCGRKVINDSKVG